MIETVTPIILQYGVLGIWTATLLWERKAQNKEKLEVQQQTTKVLQDVAVNMALVNDNLKEMANIVRSCHMQRS